MKLRTILVILLLLGISFILWRVVIQQKNPTELAYTPDPKSIFGEKSTYTNRQANFSIDYPQNWDLEIGEVTDDSMRSIRLRGEQGYIDLAWGPEYTRGGCTQKFTPLQIQREVIEVCNFTQEDGSEIWNQIVKGRGSTVFWSSAYAASPSAQTREVILSIYETLSFFEM